MKASNNILGKVLYAFLFIAVVPGVLVLWAMQADAIVSFPPVIVTIRLLPIIFTLTIKIKYFIVGLITPHHHPHQA